MDMQNESTKIWLALDMGAMHQYKMANTGCLGNPKINSDVIC